MKAEPEKASKWGDSMDYYIWDGPEDSDEELQDFVPLKNDYEVQMGIKYSKNGIMQFIDNLMSKESRQNKQDVVTANLWE